MKTEAISTWLGPLEQPVQRRLRMLGEARVVERIWEKDPTVWNSDPSTPEIADRLGWLVVADEMRQQVDELLRFAGETRAHFERVVLCGMGGSSLAPEVCRRTLGRRKGFPALTVLDTTDPATIQAIGSGGALAKTLFLISSKSGTTQETSSLFSHFWQATGEAGSQFIAITDAGTPLARLAAERGFRRTFLNPEDIGGRYSALSYFGLVPAALIGADVSRLVESGTLMAAACRADAGAANPGARLGAILGEAALAGHDKLTLVLSSGVASLGLWVEQLVAESTGKEGKGILPVVEVSPAGPEEYGTDRLFVAVRLAAEREREAAQALEELRSAGHPVVEIDIPDAAALGGEFFRWEFATAIACAVLGVNAFDQPNVAESKANTKQLLSRGVSKSASASEPDLAAFFQAVRPGDYVAVLAYVALSQANDERLAQLAGRIRSRTRAAATTAYGPRYLHSTGQLHKGGPATGHFLVVAEEPGVRLPIPGEPFDFSTLFLAQAEGDVGALARRGRPVVRVDSLDRLEGAI